MSYYTAGKNKIVNLSLKVNLTWDDKLGDTNSNAFSEMAAKFQIQVRIKLMSACLYIFFYISYHVYLSSICPSVCILSFSVVFLSLCWGLTSLLNIWGHIATVPGCNSGSLTNVLSHRNAMPQTQVMTPHPVTLYRHRANLSLCYPLMWNATLEYTTTHFNVLVRPDQEILPRPSTNTSERSTLWCYYGGSRSEAR